MAFVPDPVPSTMADFAALGRLCEEHRPRLLAMLDRRIDPRLRQRIDPEDVLQNAFVAAQRRWPEYQAGSDMRPYPWLYRLALDALLEAYKANGYDKRNMYRDVPWPDESSVLFADRLGGSASSPSRKLAREELIDRVRQVVELLDRTDREILWMRHFEGLSARETGEIVGLSETAVNTRQFRTLRKLEAIWRKLYGDPGSIL